jgi:hypothetical protein
MRASPFTEHKLVLQDFTATPAGRAFVAAAAQASGTAPAALQATISALPRLDFYVPLREHRRTWRGTGDLVVAAALGESRGTVTAYGSDGQRRSVTQASWTSGPTVFLLHPAEWKAHRVHPQVDGPGNVIQDAGDGELSGQYVLRSATGDSATVELADPDAGKKVWAFDQREARRQSGGTGGGIVTPQVCLPEEVNCSEEPPPTTVAPKDTTNLGILEVLHVCDNDNCSEGNEFEFRAAYKRASDGAITSRSTLKVGGIPGDWRGYINRPLIFREVPYYSNDIIDVDIVEIDGWPNPDDNFDPNSIIRYSDNRVEKSAGDLRCGYVNYYGLHDCTYGTWRELNFYYWWR